MKTNIAQQNGTMAARARRSLLRKINASLFVEDYPKNEQWLRTELYFALKRGKAGKAAWRKFLRTDVTPRFDGFTVLVATGQWRNESDDVERLESRVLVIVHQDSDENRQRIDAVSQKWCSLQGEESVLKVTQQAEVAW